MSQPIYHKPFYIDYNHLILFILQLIIFLLYLIQSIGFGFFFKLTPSKFNIISFDQKQI
ncbi:hypothetical protein pb186bvf_003323 [Paramecium bursaria]